MEEIRPAMDSRSWGTGVSGALRPHHPSNSYEISYIVVSQSKCVVSRPDLSAVMSPIISEGSLGRKGFIFLSSTSKSIRARDGRGSKSRCRNHGGALLTGLAVRVCSPCIHMAPRTM